MKKLLSLLLGACTIFTACTNEDDGNLATDDTQALGVKVIVNPTSRTMVTGTSFPDGHSIGVNVTMSDGTNYDNKAEGYLNMKYTATGNMPDQTWAATPAIMLSGTQGVACAYYPWTDGTNHKAIQIKAEDQIDWMWAADAANNKVSDADNEVNFVFNHAQTAVNVVVTRSESYTGAGVVADLAVESDGLASAATLDASTGTFVDGSVTGASTAIAIAQQFTLDGTTKAQQENPFMLVPVEGQTEAFTISATIDGKPYSVAAVMPNNFTGYLAGKVYTINVAVQNTGLVVKGVTIVNDWEVINLGDAEFKPNKPQQTEENYFVATFQVPESQVGQEVFLFKKIDFGPDMDLFETSFIDEIFINDLPIQKNSYERISFSEAGTYKIKVVLNDEFSAMAGMFAYLGVNSLYVDNQSEFLNLNNEEARFWVDSDFSHFETSRIEDFSAAFLQMEVPMRDDLSDLKYLNTDKATSMAGMFMLVILESIDISGFNTENVTEMSAMFQFSGIKNMDMTGIDLSNVKSMGSMFYYCSKLTKVTMTGALHPEVVTTDMFIGVKTTGTFYYDNRYDYSKIIDVLPDTWTAVPLNL